MNIALGQKMFIITRIILLDKDLSTMVNGLGKAIWIKCVSRKNVIKN